MIVYHGTVDAYLPSIQKEGLKPTPKNGFKGRIGFLGLAQVSPSRNYVYLSSLLSTAKQFADLKANYLESIAGQLVSDADQRWSIYKTGTQHIKDARPVVVTIEVPDDAKAKLKTDITAVSGKALMFKGSIPPEWIKSVSEVHL